MSSEMGETITLGRSDAWVQRVTQRHRKRPLQTATLLLLFNLANIDTYSFDNTFFSPDESNILVLVCFLSVIKH